MKIFVAYDFLAEIGHGDSSVLVGSGSREIRPIEGSAIYLSYNTAWNRFRLRFSYNTNKFTVYIQFLM